MTGSGIPEEANNKQHKVVITGQDGRVIRGYCPLETLDDPSLLGGDPGSQVCRLLEACVAEDGSKLDIGGQQVKAVFFVSSFDGNRDHEPVRFYSSGPEPQSIWVEIVFRDGEVIEGCIQNTLHHLQDDGFFLTPSSPQSNNLVIYVNKAAISGYRVLGVRMPEDE